MLRVLAPSVVALCGERIHGPFSRVLPRHTEHVLFVCSQTTVHITSNDRANAARHETWMARTERALHAL